MKNFRNPFVSLWLLSTILVGKARGDGVPEPYDDSTPICSLPLVPNDMPLAYGGIKLAFETFGSLSNCTASSGHIQALASCNASFWGNPSSEHFDVGEIDERALWPLCFDDIIPTQFLYSTDEVTLGLITQLRALGVCLLEQPYIAEFCNMQKSRRSADTITNEATIGILMGGIIGIAFAIFLMGFIMYKCNQRQQRRESSLINNASSTNSTYGATNSSAANDNTSPQAGMLTQFYHQVRRSITALRNPAVPSANLDPNLEAAANAGDDGTLTPFLPGAKP